MSCELKQLFASLPQMERGVAKVIGGDPKGNNFLYTNGKSVIIRNIDNPAIADVYTEHSHPVHVAKYSPSGFYIASGDASGKIRIWDTTQKEHLLKYEYQPISGAIKDIAWSGDNSRIAAVGEGREKFGSVFLWDSGSTVGEISIQVKAINSVDIKATRPYRLITGSDDQTSAFFEGPPFKYKLSISDHDRFVNCVRFSPDGNRYATAALDGKIFLYDGKTGEKLDCLGGEKAHEGGIYAISWSSDSSQLISASGDKTVKLWDVASNTAVTTFNLGDNTNDQQLGCLWQKDHLLSVSLSGYINYLDKNNPSRPIRVLKGHNKSIQCLTVHKAEGRDRIYTGSHDGHIYWWDGETGDCEEFAGKGHSNQVSMLAVDDSERLVTCSMDDTVRYTSIPKKEYCAADGVKMDTQPKRHAVGPDGYVVVVCIEQLVLLKDGKKVFTLGNLDYQPEAVSLHPGGGTAAVGGSDGKVHLYSIQGNTLKEEGKTFNAPGPVNNMAYSPDGAYLAVSDETRAITLYVVADGYAVKDTFYGHHAKVMCLAWSPDNEHFASGGMDTMLYVWTVSNADKRIRVQDAHRMHHISCLSWLNDHTLATAAHDSCVKQWNVTF